MECTFQSAITVSFLLERMSPGDLAQHTWSRPGQLQEVSHGHVHSGFGDLQKWTLYKLFGQPVLAFVYANSNKALYDERGFSVFHCSSPFCWNPAGSIFFRPSHWVFICMGVISLSLLSSRLNTPVSPQVAKFLSFGHPGQDLLQCPCLSWAGEPSTGHSSPEGSQQGWAEGKDHPWPDLMVILLMHPEVIQEFHSSRTNSRNKSQEETDHKSIFLIQTNQVLKVSP